MSKYDEIIEKAPIKEEIPSGIFRQILLALKTVPIHITLLQLFFIILIFNILKNVKI